MAVTRNKKETTAYINVEVATDTTAKRSFRNINPAVTNATLVAGMSLIGGLQSHSILTYSRQDKAVLISD